MTFIITSSNYIVLYFTFVHSFLYCQQMSRCICSYIWLKCILQLC